MRSARRNRSLDRSSSEVHGPPRGVLRLAFVVGFGLGIAHVAPGDAGRAEPTRDAPPPVTPRVVSIRPADIAQLGAPNPVQAPVVATRETRPAFTLPADALDVRNAALADGRYTYLDGDGTTVTLTLEPALQAAAEASLAKYRVAQGAIVAIRPSTGEIVALAEHAEGRPDIRDIALQSASPAASIFKVITAAAALEHASADPDALHCTHGGHQKLTLYHLKPDQKRDTNCETFAEALGSSNNVAFARIADTMLTPAQLQETADRFLFNTTLPFHRAVGVSRARIPTTSRLGFARTAAGFENTTLSPLHAAVLTAAVGNGGEMMVPHLVRSAEKDGETLFEATPTAVRRVLSPEIADALVGMMETTVTHGTGRKFFERRGAPRLGHYRVAGKSGSLSGRTEEGKQHYSWFVALGPVSASGTRADLAVAALVVQGEAWTVKGAVLAREMFEAELARTQPSPDAAPRRRGRR
jgi:peptidoglycan glycosyltransferase